MALDKKRRDDAATGHLTIIPRYASIDGWCSLTGMTRRRTYDLLSIGVLRGKKLQKRTLICVPHGLRILDALPDYRPASKAAAAESPDLTVA